MNEFIARNGLIALNDTTITGSLNISGSTATQFQVGNNFLFVSSSGNVGIGTSSPSYKLEVNGGPINIVNGYSDPTSEDGYRLKFRDNGGINNI